jgi:hypothetical protein
MKMQNNNEQKMIECRDLCAESHEVCTETLNHCLTIGGDHAERGHLTLLVDCAQICETSADFMSRRSRLHHVICRACTEVCEQCAQDCERFEDEEMNRCAEICKRCAEACRQMAAMSV